MNETESFSNSRYIDQVCLADGELSAFVCAVSGLFGPEEAELSTEDWLEESELMDSPPRFESRNWHAVSIAASARLADRLNAALNRQDSPHYD